VKGEKTEKVGTKRHKTKKAGKKTPKNKRSERLKWYTAITPNLEMWTEETNQIGVMVKKLWTEVDHKDGRTVKGWITGWRSELLLINKKIGWQVTIQGVNQRGVRTVKGWMMGYRSKLLLNNKKKVGGGLTFVKNLGYR